MKLLIILAVLMGLLVSGGDLFAKVTHVTASVSPTSWSGKCPKRFEFTGKITVDKPGTVKYKWIRSDGANAPVKTLRFRRPGSQTVKTYWQLSAPGEKWEAIEILAPNPMKSNKAAFTLKCGPGLVDKSKGTKRKSVSMGKEMVVKPGDLHIRIDLAAQKIRFKIVKRYGQYHGRVRIIGVVKNIGAGAFIAAPNQAKAYLYQMPLAVPCASPINGDIVAQRSIENLAVGATIELSYERDWRSTSQAEGEFPHCYRLLIKFDPDVYNDANEYNNDGNPTNNKKDRSGADINGMLN
jgi:hypothetical protein